MNDDAAMFLNVSIIGFAIQIVVILIALYIFNRASRQAQLDALKAQEGAATAQAQAANAARALIESASASDIKLGHISQVGDATHKIINSQRIVTLQLVATLAGRVAHDNPHDKPAQEAAAQAKEALADARTAASLADKLE